MKNSIQIVVCALVIAFSCSMQGAQDSRVVNKAMARLTVDELVTFTGVVQKLKADEAHALVAHVIQFSVQHSLPKKAASPKPNITATRLQQDLSTLNNITSLADSRWQK